MQLSPTLGRAAVWYGTTGPADIDAPQTKNNTGASSTRATHRTLSQILREMTTVVAEADQEEVELSLSLCLGGASRASHVLKDKSDVVGHGSKSVGGDDHPSLERKKVGGTSKNHGELERFLSCPPQSNYRGEYGHTFKPCYGVPHLTTPAVLRPCKKPRHRNQDSGHGNRGECVTDIVHTTSPARETLGADYRRSSRSCFNGEHLRRQQSTTPIEPLTCLDQPPTHLDTNKPMCPSSAGKTQPLASPLRSILSMNQEKMTGNEIRGMGLESEAHQGLPKMPCVSATGNGPNGKTVKGFLYRYTRAEVTIVCVCHGSSFSPAEFVKHSGGTDVSNPLKHIVVVPSEL